MANRVVRWAESKRFDLVAAVVGLLIAVALFPLRFLADQIYIDTVPLVLASACGLYVVGVYWDRGDVRFPVLPSPIARLLPGVSLTGMAGMIAVATYMEARTPAFHAIAIAVAAVLFLQVLFSDDPDLRPGLTLVQIVLFAGVLRFSALYVTPGMIGIDIWTHLSLTRRIVDAHSIAAIHNNKYYASPLYHLLVGSASMLYDLPLREALYLSLGLVMPVSVLLVYATTAHIVERRWAILAALLYSLGDYVVEWGLHLIPTSLGLVFYLGIVYSLVRITRTEYNARDYVLLLVITVALILTHQVSSFIMLVTVIGAIVTQVVLALGLLDVPQNSRHMAFEARDPVNLGGLFMFDVGFLTFMWSMTPYKGDSFLETILSFLRETVVSSAGFLNLAGPSSSGASAAAGQAPTLMDKVALYADNLGFLVLLFATFVGCLYVVNRERADQSVVTLLVATATMLVFVLGLPIFGIRNFIPTRWFAFLYAPMAVLGAVGLRHLSFTLDRKLLVVTLVLFLVLFPGSMLLSSEATVENPVFSNQRAELAYSRPELAASKSIGDVTGSPSIDEIRGDQVLYTDHPYQTVIERRGSQPSNVAVLNRSQPSKHDITVYRRQQSTEATFFRVNGTGRALNVPRDRVCRPTQNVLYSNGDVVLCTAPS